MLAHEVAIGIVGHFQNVVWPAHDAHHARHLAEQGVQVFTLRLEVGQRIVEFELRADQFGEEL